MKKFLIISLMILSNLLGKSAGTNTLFEPRYANGYFILRSNPRVDHFKLTIIQVELNSNSTNQNQGDEIYYEETFKSYFYIKSAFWNDGHDAKNWFIYKVDAYEATGNLLFTEWSEGRRDGDVRIPEGSWVCNGVNYGWTITRLRDQANSNYILTLDPSPNLYIYTSDVDYNANWKNGILQSAPSGFYGASGGISINQADGVNIQVIPNNFNSTYYNQNGTLITSPTVIGIRKGMGYWANYFIVTNPIINGNLLATSPIYDAILTMNSASGPNTVSGLSLPPLACTPGLSGPTPIIGWENPSINDCMDNPLVVTEPGEQTWIDCIEQYANDLWNLGPNGVSFNGLTVSEYSNNSFKLLGTVEGNQINKIEDVLKKIIPGSLYSYTINFSNGKNLIVFYDFDYNGLRLSQLSSTSNIKGLVIAPNPSKGIFKIYLENNSKINEISIFDLAGHKIPNELLNININNGIDVDFSNNAVGIYTIEVSTDSQNYHGKIVIQE